MKNTIKKIVATLVCLSILFATPVLSFADDLNLKDEHMEACLEFLNAMGIIETTIDDIMLEKPVKRAEFALAAANIYGNLGYSEDAEPLNDSGFLDIDEQDGEVINAINLLNKLGIVSGVGENRFEPMTTITYEAAVKITVSMLGYDLRALQDGGYPTGYMMWGSRLGVLDNVNFESGAELKWRDFIVMIYNALFVDIMQTQSYGCDT